MIGIIFTVAVIVLFFHVLTWEGQIFEFVSKSLDKLSDYLKKPLFDCAICMTIWWGPSVVACGILGRVWIVTNVWQLAIIVAAAAGLNAIFMYIVNQGKAIAKILNDYECNCTKKEDKDLERKERLADATVKLSGVVGEQHVSNT